jgi:Sap-like sulfolipid-1-addressing protein
MRSVGDVGTILVLALWAMFNPTLLAAVTVMLLLPEPKRLMLGYLLGAYLTSITLGMIIVFSLHGSSDTSTARTTLTPLEDLGFGVLFLVIGFVLRSRWLEVRRERRRERKAGKPKKESWPERMLGRGSARVTFAVGAALTLPGASYLVALDKMAKLNAPVPATALLVVVFCVVQMALLELPLIGYALAPDWTQGAVTRFREWLARRGLEVAAKGAIVIGVLLLIRGTLELVL